MKSSIGIAVNVSYWTVPREPSSSETRASVFSSGASTTLTKSKWPSVAHWAFTVAPSCSISLLTSLMRAGLFLTVCTPSGVNVVSMIQVGTSAPLSRVLPGSGSTRSVGGARCGYAAAMRRPLAVAVPLLAGSLAAAAPAPAATLAPLKACYVSAGRANTEREPIAINAQGFTPNGTATVSLDGVAVQPMTAIDPAGAIAGSLPAPFQARGQRPFTLSILENGNPANAVAAESLVTTLDVRVTPSNARPSSRVRFR